MLTDSDKKSRFINHRPYLKIDLFAALESLPAHYLEGVLLRDFAELTIAEMAEKLGMQVPGVKSRLHRARALVREYLIGLTAEASRATD